MDMKYEIAADESVKVTDVTEETVLETLSRLKVDDFLILMHSDDSWIQTRRMGETDYLLEFRSDEDFKLYEASPPFDNYSVVTDAFRMFLAGGRNLVSSFPSVTWWANPEYQGKPADSLTVELPTEDEPKVLASHTNGYEFEVFVSTTLQNSNWSTRLTSKSGDQGLDVLAFDDYYRVAVQCKRYGNPVGNSAVQEVHAAADCFGATHAVVVTTSSYTPAAQQLAQALGVILLHEDQLTDLRRHLVFIPPRKVRKERIRME